MKNLEPQTVMAAFDACVKKYGDRPALHEKHGDSWQATTWREYREQVRTTARAFMTLGLEAGEGVAIIGANRSQWLLSDVAAIFAGGFPAGIYATNSPEQCQYIADHSDASIAVVENAEQLAKFKQVRSRLPKLNAIVMMLGEDEDEDIYSWSDLPALAEKTPEADLEARIAAQKPEDLCTLIYTSGTTADPKGVMLSHDNATWTAAASAKRVNAGPDDRMICYLPLSHVAEQVLCVHLPLLTGQSTWFCHEIEKIGEALQDVRPTLFLSVPRLWEKIQSKMVAAGTQNSPLKKKIVAWARRVGLAAAYADELGRSRPFFYFLANKLVFSKAADKLGLDQCRLMGTSTAPITKDTLDFYLSLGLPLYAIYGLSETTAPATIGVPGVARHGTTGTALDGVEIKTAADGELLVHGRNVFMGYYKNEEASREVLVDGWFHTGDIGEIDAQGNVRITDRKKEILITSGGENVAPQMVEAKLKGIPAVAQAVAVGDGRKYLSALLALDPENLEAEAAAAGSPARELTAAAQCPKMRAYVQQHIDEINGGLARVQTIKQFTILPGELSIDGGELTPTMKLKRRVIHEKYAAEIEAMYADAAAPAAEAQARPSA